MRTRNYEIRKALRAGEVIDLEGLELEMAPGQLEAGDLYVAGRNTAPKLLTVRSVDRINGWVHAVENAYSYNVGECVKVAEA